MTENSISSAPTKSSKTEESSEITTVDEIFTRKIRNEIHDFLDKSNEKEIQELNELTPLKIRWLFLIHLINVHVSSFYSVYLILTETKWLTLVFVAILDIISSLGTTAGMHRLWCHRSYKATLPLRIFLAIGATIPLQLSISHWVRDHRVHHKYTDTNADPYNAKRGFWYSHITWICTLETEDTIRKYKTIDMSDIKSDPVTNFQYQYYVPLTVIITFILPTVIPMWMWGESLQSAYFVAVILRLLISHHQTFIVSSFAHKYGYRPYDVNIYPTENKLVSIIAFGEGFHNYHHTFPWDYATSELGTKYNLTTVFIDIMAWLGLASDRKTVPKYLIEARKRRTGEGYLQELKDIQYNSEEKLSKQD